MSDRSERDEREAAAIEQEQEKLAGQIAANSQLAKVALTSFVLAVEALRPAQA